MFYTLTSTSTNGYCPLCNTKLKNSHMGEYCDNCSYLDGTAVLNDVQYERFKQLIKKGSKESRR